jgi:hypothetical protein
MAFSNLVSLAVMISTAATLHGAGVAVDPSSIDRTKPLGYDAEI